MTIKECIDIVDNIKPNGYSIRDKVMWLSFIDEIIINDVLRTHEGYDGRYDTFTGYSEDNLSAMLIAPSPYDRLYTAYLEMKIDEKNGETARYNNSMTLFNTYMMEYRKYYNKTHMPLDVTEKKMQTPPKQQTVGLSDAEYENLKRGLYALLSKELSDVTSPDKIQAIVNTYVMNNAEMLKGKPGVDGKDGEDGYTPKKGIDYFDGKKGDKGEDGRTPIRGVDYWTEDDKAKIFADSQDIIDEKTSGKQDRFDDETLEFIGNLGNVFDRVASNTLSLTQKQSKLSEEQLANIDKIPTIEQTATGAEATAQNAFGIAGNAYDLAEYASVTANSVQRTKQDKIRIETRADMNSHLFDFLDMYNAEMRLLDSEIIQIEFRDDEYLPDYISGLSFNSGETPTSFVYTNSGIINWIGTDCSISEGLSVFAPSPNTHYDVIFYYNGVQFIGLVNGFVPASGNVVSE
jgi:hypothetical protein